MTGSKKRFDDILEEIGDFGKFQLIQYCLSGTGIIIAAMYSLNMVFIGFPPEHNCMPSQQIAAEWDNLTVNLQNAANDTDLSAFLSRLSLMDFYVPLVIESDTVTYDQCSSYEYSSSNTSITDVVNKLIAQDWWSRVLTNKSENYSAQISFETRQKQLDAFLKSVLTRGECSNGWRFSKEYFSSSIVTRWNLVCSEYWLISVVKMIFFAGRLVGSYVFGSLGDRFGRRAILLSNYAGLAVCSIGCAFAPNLIVFSAIYSIQGAMQAGLSAAAYVHACELAAPRKRLILGTMVQLFFSVGYLMLTGIAYLVRDYFWVQISLAVPSTVVFFVYFFLAVESPRWLVSRGREHEAVRILCRAAKMNGTQISDERIEQLVAEVVHDGPRRGSEHKSLSKATGDQESPSAALTSHKHRKERRRLSTGRSSVSASIHDLPKISLADDQDSDPEDAQPVAKPSEQKMDASYRSLRSLGKPVEAAEQAAQTAADAEEPDAAKVNKKYTYSIFDLFSNCYIAKVTGATWFAFFVCANSYYGLSLFADRLDGNPYVNFALCGLIEIPACFIAAFVAKQLGRIRTVMFSCLIGSAACLLTAYVMHKLARLIAALSGKLMVTTAYCVVCLIASEVFPTVVRNLGYGAASVCARIGGIIAPLLLNLPVQYAFLFFFVFLLANSIACWLLPDFGQRQLPETIEDLKPEFTDDDVHASSRLLRYVRRFWRTGVRVCCGCVTQTSDDAADAANKVQQSAKYETVEMTTKERVGGKQQEASYA